MRFNPFKGADLYDLEEGLARLISRRAKAISTFFGHIIKAIKRKGNEKITLMFIPHSEKQILNFHISIFAISFFSLILIAVITTTSIMIINHTSTIKEITRLKLYGYDSKVQIQHYQKEIDDLYQSFQEFKPELTYLYSLTPDNYVDSLWAKGGISETDPASLPEATTGKVPDMEELNADEMKRELETTKEVLKEIKVFLANRKKVIENTPSIWPTDGYITSTFRSTSPLNGSSDNNGVDITTFPGAEIRATAPGTIEEVKWDEEQGLTMVIHHKYGFSTTYSHCQRATVKVEQKVSKGEVVGYVGKTGNTNIHKLSYQIKIGMEFVDPLPYLNRLPRPVQQ